VLILENQFCCTIEKNFRKPSISGKVHIYYLFLYGCVFYNEYDFYSLFYVALCYMHGMLLNIIIVNVQLTTIVVLHSVQLPAMRVTSCNVKQ